MVANISRLRQGLKQAYDKARLSERSHSNKIVTRFAAKYGLVRFSSDWKGSGIRGVTITNGYHDTNICIGTHDGYDMAYLERTAELMYDGMPSSSHRWHIMAFDLHLHSDLPFIFIGTKQQSKTFYARLFDLQRSIRQIDTSILDVHGHFSAHYTVMASPAQQVFLAQLFTEPITSTMAKHHLPFAVEIENDTIYVITEATQTTEDLLARMMHYGLWLAKHLDQVVA